MKQQARCVLGREGLQEFRVRPLDGASWVSTLPPDADEFHRNLYEMLDQGILEAWSDEGGVLRFYAAGGEGKPARPRVEQDREVRRHSRRKRRQ